MKQLGPQLVPASCWYSNVRTSVPKSIWAKIRKAVFVKHGNRCWYCNANPKSLDCHEIWGYSEDTQQNAQILIDIVPLCKMCHMVCHFGMAGILGKQNQAAKHMARIRNITLAQVGKEIEEAQVDFDRKSNLQWELDLTKLKEFL